MSKRNLPLSPRESFADSDSYIFKNLIKFPKRWYKIFIFYFIFQKVMRV